MIRSSLRSLSVWVFAVALVLAACAPTQEDTEAEGGGAEVPEQVLIGATLPLTGEEADAGNFYKEGYELAFEMAAFVPSDADSLRPHAAVAVAKSPAARTSRRILP